MADHMMEWKWVEKEVAAGDVESILLGGRGASNDETKSHPLNNFIVKFQKDAFNAYRHDDGSSCGDDKMGMVE